MNEAILMMKEINKRFLGSRGLNKCNFELKEGEVHGIAGESGAGKSTLMKILTGEERKEAGKILYKGEEINPANPKHIKNKGIAMVSGEYSLIPYFSVAQNLFIGRELTKFGFFTDDKRMNQEAKKMLEDWNLNIAPEVCVSALTLGQQEMVKIIRTFSYDFKVLILDETTVALTKSQTTRLFEAIHKRKSQGCGIIYISRSIDELMEVTDRITVMRNGEHIQTINTVETTKEIILNLMGGGTAYEVPKREGKVMSDEVVLSVKDLRSGKWFKEISFDLKRGEILGFFDSVGVGSTVVARTIFGGNKRSWGEVLVKGERVFIQSPKDGIRHGIAYLPKDRKSEGLTLGMSAESNVVLASLNIFSKLGLVKARETDRIAKEFAVKLNIQTASMKQNIKCLSGGDQQKVMIARWLIRKCDIFIFDEPTKGMDTGERQEIYALMERLAKSGKSILMMSADISEILRMCHRVAVMRKGQIVQILDSKNEEEMVMKRIGAAPNG